MKKRIICTLLFLSVSLMGGCSQGENSSEQSVLNGREQVAKELADLEVLDWSELTCNADEADSLRNSNLLNMGYLTMDGEGKIYFLDFNAGGIYVCGPQGEDKKLLASEEARNLQIAGEWLYLSAESGGIKRIHRSTGSVEYVYEGNCGDFVVKGERLYVSMPEGFCSMTLEGLEKNVLRENNPLMVTCVNGNEFWLGNAANDEDAEWFWKGYLLGYNEAQSELYYVAEGATYPLLAGNWISVFDVDTVTRHVWDLKTGEDVDLKVYDQRVVCDGNSLYYTVNEDTQVGFYKWDGENALSIFATEATAVPYKYLTADFLYWVQNVERENKDVVEWWYYNLETGETGQFS